MEKCCPKVISWSNFGVQCLKLYFTKCLHYFPGEIHNLKLMKKIGTIVEEWIWDYFCSSEVFNDLGDVEFGKKACVAKLYYDKKKPITNGKLQLNETIKLHDGDASKVKLYLVQILGFEKVHFKQIEALFSSCSCEQNQKWQSRVRRIIHYTYDDNSSLRFI